MCAIKRATFSVALLGAVLVATPAGPATAAEPLAVTKSGKDLIFSFPTASPNLYTVQTCPDLLQWTNIPSGVPGDGTMKTFTASNAISTDLGFYRLLIQKPVGLLLPQSLAFGILGHSCGGIKEHAYVTGFDPTTGFPTGEVYLSTTCSTGGRGSRPATFTAWAAVTWDFGGNVISSSALSNTAPVSTTFIANDMHKDAIYNSTTAAYLVVPIPTAPTDVTAVQSDDQFQVSWTVNGVDPVAVTSSIVTATPINSTAPVLTTTVSGPAAGGVISPLQPDTTYQITVVNTSVGGTSPPSTPISVTTSPATIPPSVPTGVTASWSNPDPSGTTDTIVANWQAANPGNSPIDQYLVTITGSDGAGTFTQTVSGTTLTAYFSVDYIPNWSVTVQAHNAAGWGPISSAVHLGGL